MRKPREATPAEVMGAVRLVSVRWARVLDITLRTSDSVNVRMIDSQGLGTLYRRQPGPLEMGWTLGSQPWQRFLGMPLEVDPYLPSGVWRLTTADGGLLFDCREED